MAGMKTIQDLTRPVVPREGVRPPVGIKRVIADRMPVDPYSPITGEKSFWRKDPIEMLKEAPGKGLEGLLSLIGAGAAEGSELDNITNPEGMLNILKLQLMLEKGMPGSTLMPPGNPDKIKQIEERIRQIEIKLGQ